MSILFPSIHGNFGHNLYAAIYGFLAGGFNYNLKMHIYEMSKSRHFALMWSCVRGIQSIGVGIGVTTFGINFENVDVNVSLGQRVESRAPNLQNTVTIQKPNGPVFVWSFFVQNLCSIVECIKKPGQKSNFPLG